MYPTFQQCMMTIFTDMVEMFMEIFMDDFSVYRESFETCLCNLEKVLQWCEKKIELEKCHFMVNEGIVLGHKISRRRIGVERAKIEAIEKLNPPTSVKEI